MRYASDDAQAAYLFQCGNEELFAVCLDKTGVRLPRSSCTQGWILRAEFEFGVQRPVPAPIAPEPILRGIAARGYYIWRGGYAGQPKGTSSDRLGIGPGKALSIGRRHASWRAVRHLRGDGR
jgi:hypothetical protein